VIDRANQLRRKAVQGRLAGVAALLLLCALFAAIIVNSLWAAAERRRAEAGHHHSLEVLLTAGQLETEINAAIRGERGYLITGDREFLQPYFQGRSRSVRLIARLRALTLDTETQRPNLAAVDRRLRIYFATLARIVALEESGRHEQAIAAVRNRMGRSQIIDLLAALHRLEATERRLLELRHRASARADVRIEIYNYCVAAAGAVLMALLAIAILSVIRAYRRTFKLADELHDLATTDALTGLPNRRQLMIALEKEIGRAERSGRPLSLALLDVDRFKAVNDTHGHSTGDDVLRDIADELLRMTRAGDVVGRYGGEEFAILMPGTKVAEAQRVCERLRIAIERRIIQFPDGGAGHVTVSTGVALLNGDERLGCFIARADSALYAAKAGGRNLVRLAA
jgi:diguanylate cyclase (GGDEF)-like protein